MDHPAIVRMLECAADLDADAQRLLQGEPVMIGPLQEVVHRAARHELAHDVGLAVLLTHIEHRHDVGISTQPSQRRLE